MIVEEIHNGRLLESSWLSHLASLEALLAIAALLRASVPAKPAIGSCSLSPSRRERCTTMLVVAAARRVGRRRRKS